MNFISRLYFNWCSISMEKSCYCNQRWFEDVTIWSYWCSIVKRIIHSWEWNERKNWQCCWYEIMKESVKIRFLFILSIYSYTGIFRFNGFFSSSTSHGQFFDSSLWTMRLYVEIWFSAILLSISDSIYLSARSAVLGLILLKSRSYCRQVRSVFQINLIIFDWYL